MEKLLNDLKIWGCEVDAALERFIGDKELYCSCLEEVAFDENLLGLGEALYNKNVPLAFDYAHSLKGVILNMGIIPIFNELDKIVEPLRGGSAEDLLTAYDKVVLQNQILRSMIIKNVQSCDYEIYQKAL